MNVRFGNMSVLAFEDKARVNLSEEDRVWMVNHLNPDANRVDPDKFHIFELPFSIIAGEDIGPELVRRLTVGNYEFKRHFTVETVEK